MRKKTFYFIIFISSIKLCLSQEQKLIYLNDSLALKKEILETFLIGKKRSSIVFNEYASAYKGFLVLKNSKKFKEKLKNYFPQNIVNTLLQIGREELYPVIHWTDVLKKNPLDTVGFIWDRQVDDFLHIDDSVMSVMKTVKYERKFLWYMATEVFAVAKKNEIQTYAIVYSYPYQNKESYGFDIDLYEKKNGKWNVLWRFTQNTPLEIQVKQAALNER